MPRYRVVRPVTGRLWVQMPYDPRNRAWLKEVLGDRIRPDWDKPNRRWLIARAHFGMVVEALANRLGRIDVYVDCRNSERCDTRCKNAKSRECTCQCLGKHHGSGITHGWKLVSDTTEVLSTGVTRRHFVVVRDRSK